MSQCMRKGIKITNLVFVDSNRRNLKEYEYIKIISMYKKLMLLFLMLKMFQNSIDVNFYGC